MARDEYDGLLDGLADPTEAATKEAPARGRPKDPESLSSQLDAGKAKQLKAIVPTGLHRRLKAQAGLQDRQISEIVAEALYVWLEQNEVWPDQER